MTSPTGDTAVRVARARPPAKAGFTLVEILVVTSIIAVVMGISAGMLMRAGRAGVLDGAVRVTRATLQRARGICRSEGALSRVVVRPYDEKTQHRAQLGFSWSRIAGSWHFDDPNEIGLGGNQIYAQIMGGAPVEGFIRGGIQLVAQGRISAPPLTEAPTHDPSHGFTIELDIKPDSTGALARFGPRNAELSTFVLRLDDLGALSAEVTTQPQQQITKVKSPAGVVEMGQWTRVGLWYDGVDLAILAHNVVQARVAEIRDLDIAPDGALSIGGFAGVVDEVVYRTVSEEEKYDLEAGVDFKLQAPLTVRFDREGHLNERFHSKGLEITIVQEDKKATVSVDMAGVIR